LANDIPELCFSPLSGYRRASQRRVRGFRGNRKSQVIEELKAKGEIKELEDHALTLYSRQLLSTAHPDVLTHLIRNDVQSIAIEVPVWSARLMLTGHIDLIRLENGTLQIVDYKPAGDFFVTLPQITTYVALLLEHIPNLALNAECITFNHQKTWIYKPTILRALPKNNVY